LVLAYLYAALQYIYRHAGGFTHGSWTVISNIYLDI